MIVDWIDPEGSRSSLGSLLLGLVSPTRAEAGCLSYELNTSQEKSGVFLFYEKFVNQKALDAHVGSTHFQNFLKQREGNDPIEVMKWRDIFDNVEEATDRCEDVANIIEGVILEHA